MHVLGYCIQNKCDNTTTLLHYLQRTSFGIIFFSRVLMTFFSTSSSVSHPVVDEEKPMGFRCCFILECQIK